MKLLGADDGRVFVEWLGWQVFDEQEGWIRLPEIDGAVAPIRESVALTDGRLLLLTDPECETGSTAYLWSP